MRESGKLLRGCLECVGEEAIKELTGRKWCDRRGSEHMVFETQNSNLKLEFGFEITELR